MTIKTAARIQADARRELLRLRKAQKSEERAAKKELAAAIREIKRGKNEFLALALQRFRATIAARRAMIERHARERAAMAERIARARVELAERKASWPQVRQARIESARAFFDGEKEKLRMETTRALAELDTLSAEAEVLRMSRGAKLPPPAHEFTGNRLKKAPKKIAMKKAPAKKALPNGLRKLPPKKAEPAPYKPRAVKKTRKKVAKKTRKQPRIRPEAAKKKSRDEVIQRKVGGVLLAKQVVFPTVAAAEVLSDEGLLLAALYEMTKDRKGSSWLPGEAVLLALITRPDEATTAIGKRMGQDPENSRWGDAYLLGDTLRKLANRERVALKRRNGNRAGDVDPLPLISRSGFQADWEHALNASEEITGVQLLKPPTAAELKRLAGLWKTSIAGKPIKKTRATIHKPTADEMRWKLQKKKEAAAAKKAPIKAKLERFRKPKPKAQPKPPPPPKAPASKAPAKKATAKKAPSEAAKVLTVIRSFSKKDPLVYVPAVAKHKSLAALSAFDVRRVLMELQRAQKIELRPESGIGTLSKEDARLCPAGPFDTILSYLRLLPPKSQR